MINYTKRFNNSPYLPYCNCNFEDKSNKVQGSGFIKNSTYTKTTQKVIDKFKDYNVDHFTIVSFLMPEVSFIRNLASKSRVPYDKLYHLSANLTVSKDGKTYNLLYEKDSNVFLKEQKIPTNKVDMTTKKVDIPFDITLDDFLKIHRKYMKDRKYFNYSAFELNCQDFILKLLKALDLYTPELQKIVVPNDTEVLKQDLPSWSKGATDLLNDLKILWSKFKGEGVRPPP